MKLALTIEYETGEKADAIVLPRTQVAFERHFKTRLGDAGGVSMEQMYWLAWHALKIGEPFDRWLETIVEVEAHTDEDDEDVDDPLAMAPPSGTLSLQP